MGKEGTTYEKEVTAHGEAGMTQKEEGTTKRRWQVRRWCPYQGRHDLGHGWNGRHASAYERRIDASHGLEPERATMCMVIDGGKAYATGKCQQCF